MAQPEPAAQVGLGGGEERGCLVKSVAAEPWATRSVVEGLSGHFQGVGRRDRGHSCAAASALRGRRLDPSAVVFQALSVIELVVGAQETPCWLLGRWRCGSGRRRRSDW